MSLATQLKNFLKVTSVLKDKGSVLGLPLSAFGVFIMNKSELNKLLWTGEYKDLVSAILEMNQEIQHLKNIKRGEPIETKDPMGKYIIQQYRQKKNNLEAIIGDKIEASEKEVLEYFTSQEGFVDNYNKWKETKNKYYRPTIYADGAEANLSSFTVGILGKWEGYKKSQVEVQND